MYTWALMLSQYVLHVFRHWKHMAYPNVPSHWTRNRDYQYWIPRQNPSQKSARQIAPSLYNPNMNSWLSRKCDFGRFFIAYLVPFSFTYCIQSMIKYPIKHRIFFRQKILPRNPGQRGAEYSQKAKRIKKIIWKYMPDVWLYSLSLYKVLHIENLFFDIFISFLLLYGNYSCTVCISWLWRYYSCKRYCWGTIRTNSTNISRKNRYSRSRLYWTSSWWKDKNYNHKKNIILKHMLNYLS